MSLLANILQGDRSDLDLIHLALETLTKTITYDAVNDVGMLLITIVCFLFNAFVCCLEQWNLPDDITIQLTGIRFVG